MIFLECNLIFVPCTLLRVFLLSAFRKECWMISIIVYCKSLSVCLESPVRCQEIQIDSQQHSENVGGSKIGKIVTNFLSLETTVALREHENQTCSQTTESITWVWESSCKSWFVSVRPDLGEDWNLNSPLHLVFLSKPANKSCQRRIRIATQDETVDSFQSTQIMCFLPAIFKQIYRQFDGNLLRFTVSIYRRVVNLKLRSQ